MMRMVMAWLLVLAGSGAWAQDRILTLSGFAVWDSAPLLLLVETQPLSDHGIHFKFEAWRAPEELGAMLLRSDVHVASAPGMLAPIFASRGLDLALLGTSAPQGNIAIVYRQEAGQIAVPFKGGMPDLILRSIEQRNMMPRYTATPVEAMQLLLSGRVAAAFLAEPFIAIAMAKADGDLQMLDACDLWQGVHDLNHCPATGVFLANDLSLRDAKLIGAALASAHGALATQPETAARLLKAEFPMLQEAPLAIAFSRITPHFQQMCETAWITQTLNILEPLAPFNRNAASLSWSSC